LARPCRIAGVGDHGEKLMNDKGSAMQGVVLSSGGADGAYAVGVMKALFTGQSPASDYQPVNPGVLVGTSIGSFNASFLVSQAEAGMSAAIAELEEMWLNEMSESFRHCGNGAYRFRLDLLKLLDPQCFGSHPISTLASFAGDSIFLSQDFLKRATNFGASNATLEKRALNLLNLSSFVSLEPYTKLIEKRVSFENIRRSQTALRVITTNWDRGVVETFHNQEFTDELGAKIITASSAIPGFFPHVVFNGDIHVDGSVLGYTRLAPAIDAGAETLHVIYLDPDVQNIPDQALESTLDTLYRVFVIGWAARVNEGIDAVERINQQLVVLEQLARKANLSRQDLKPLLLTLVPSNRIKEQIIKITLHRYHPRDDLSGPIGLLDLNRQRLERLIERGFNDAVKHDCDDSRCVRP
jgi:predicted acylesterase/phospholipase RssA